MDEKYMKRAIELAERGRGQTSPNPLVGALVVKESDIVGEGYHAKAGGPHAEVVALRQAGKEARGAVLYTSLEPCSVYGLTPPCTGAILKAGVSKAVVGLVDPNPQVCGEGIKQLEKAGVAVEVGILASEVKRQNEIYFKYVTTRIPFVLMKAAASLDGKISTGNGKRSQITGEVSMAKVHELRDEFDAVMVGIGTVVIDNPKLTARLKGGGRRNPTRIIVDSGARIPLDSEVVATAKQVPTIVATTNQADEAKVKQLEQRGVEVLTLSSIQGRVNLNLLLEELGARKITSVLLEGGATVNAAAVRERIVDKFLFFVAPKIIGGSDSLNVVKGEIGDWSKLRIASLKRTGQDLLVEAYPLGRSTS